MRVVQRIIGSAFLVLVLTGCANSPQHLAPEEVMRRTVIAGRMLDSVELSTSGSIKLVNGDRFSTVALTATGVIHAGTAWSLHLKTVTNRIASTGSGNLVGGTLAAPGGGSVFVRINAVAGPDAPPIQLLLSGSAISQWWLLAGDPSVISVKTIITPAHQNIGAFLSAFDSLSDLGIVKEGGRRQYHYSMKARPDLGTSSDETEKFSTIAGEVWIDAETFFLSRAIWRFADVPTIAGILSGTITVSLHDHNQASGSIFPAVSGERFPLQDFLKILL